jgi:transcriptional regulator with XRE-family HTH domain
MAMSTQHAEFCQRLRARRVELGLTQVDVAEMLGIKQPSYAKFETGIYEPRLRTLYRLATVLDVSVYDLLPPSCEPVEQ